MNLKDGTLKLLGIGATAIGLGVSLLSGWVGDKKLDAEISKKVTKALAEKK